ncbi:salivary glue protein Sgs-3-like isoform X2 [Gigantopelta aegis]|uniref:salivary glue protein Sgs-3-like isoform X2 n=1 Tax=Gigantopelta aegis TaxID=1735272 RepID=UPI001B88C26A|nr:salivary glue protein Sgs-3-like isoform X2 [Gigantopelta aegis]
MDKLTELVIFGCLALMAVNLTTVTSDDDVQTQAQYVKPNCCGIMRTTEPVCAAGYQTLCRSMTNMSKFCTSDPKDPRLLLKSFTRESCREMKDAAARFCILENLIHLCHKKTTTTTKTSTTTMPSTTYATTISSTTPTTTIPTTKKPVCTAPNTCLKPDCDPANLRPQYTCANNNVCCEIRRIRGVVKTSRP